MISNPPGLLGTLQSIDPLAQNPGRICIYPFKKRPQQTSFSTLFVWSKRIILNIPTFSEIWWLNGSNPLKGWKHPSWGFFSKHLGGWGPSCWVKIYDLCCLEMHLWQKMNCNRSRAWMTKGVVCWCVGWGYGVFFGALCDGIRGRGSPSYHFIHFSILRTWLLIWFFWGFFRKKGQAGTNFMKTELHKKFAGKLYIPEEATTDSTNYRWLRKHSHNNFLIS